MTVSVCPSAIVSAPPERVWELLTSPEGVDAWVDAAVVAAEPDGPARPGQRLRLEASALGRRWPITIDVLEVDSERRRLHFRVDLPLGLVNDETMTMAAVDDGKTLVRFG